MLQPSLEATGDPNLRRKQCCHLANATGPTPLLCHRDHLFISAKKQRINSKNETGTREQRQSGTRTALTTNGRT